MVEAAIFFDCKNLLPVTNDEEKTIEAGGYKIAVVKAWKWMLGGGY